MESIPTKQVFTMTARNAQKLFQQEGRESDIGDPLAPELVDQSAEVKEHQDATNYIHDLEKELKEKDERISHLEAQLKQAHQRIEDTAEDQKQLQVDLNQEKISVKFYRRLKDDAEERANAYQKKMMEAFEKEKDVESLHTKMRCLETEVDSLRQSNTEFANKLRFNEEFYHELEKKLLARLDEKEKACLTSVDDLAKQKIRNDQLSEDNRVIEEQYQDVMESMESVSINLTADFNASKEHARMVELQLNALISEIKPLCCFYAQASDILSIYEGLIKQILNVTEPNISFSPDLPKELSKRQQVCKDSCEAFEIIRSTFAKDNVHQNDDDQQLSELAASAANMDTRMSNINRDMIQFLLALEHRPGIREVIKYKYQHLTKSI